jgi:Ala-tRNA(Pro) deacylase
MDVFNKIKQLFDQAGIEYQVIDHEPVLTCEDAAKIRGTRPEQGAKALVCMADLPAVSTALQAGKKPILIVLPCSSRLDFKAFKKWQEIKDLRMASAEEVKNVTGIEVGAIPPVGEAIGLQTFVDEKLLKEEEICFNAGMHTRSVTMKSRDYTKVVKPVVGCFNI